MLKLANVFVARRTVQPISSAEDRSFCGEADSSSVGQSLRTSGQSATPHSLR